MPSPGAEFAAAVLAAGAADTELRLAVSLPTLFPFAKHRPRYTVRHLLKTRTVAGGPVPVVVEAPPPGATEVSGTTYAASPEAGFMPRLAGAGLADVTATVPVPPGLLGDPTLLAAFFDERVLVRLGTVENEVLLHGSQDKLIPGLLGLSGVRRRTATGSLDEEVLIAAAEVEEMGGSCDGIVAHPVRYWQLLGSGLLSRLGEAGVRVSRTRMIGPEQLLFGDFRAALTLLETGTSDLAMRRGAGSDGTDVITAGLRIGLAVHLRQHLLLVDLP